MMPNAIFIQNSKVSGGNSTHGVTLDVSNVFIRCAKTLPTKAHNIYEDFYLLSAREELTPRLRVEKMLQHACGTGSTVYYTRTNFLNR